MADLSVSFCGIKAPNPFWLASAPPTDKAYNVERAFRAGWGGVVWKTLGEDGPPIVNVSGPRYDAWHGPDRRVLGFTNIELITDRPLEINLREITQVKRDWPDRALLVSLMVPCVEEAWKAILPRVEATGCDGVELNFGCPHGMSERGMGAAVGQVPEYIEMVTRWCKAHTRMPVFVKLTPNVADIRHPARAALKGGADAVSLINTVTSVMGVDLDTMTPMPPVDGHGTHGGYCGPSVKPIGLNMVGQIARDPATRDLPLSGIGGITTWRDAAEYIALGCGTVQVCTAAMVYGFKIIDELTSGLEAWMDEKGHARGRRFRRPRRAALHRMAASQPRLCRQGADRPGSLHQVRALPCRLRGHLAPGDHAREGRQAPFRGDRRRMRRLQSLRRRLPGRELRHAGSVDRGRRPAHRRGGRRTPDVDGASEQPGGGGVRAVIHAGCHADARRSILTVPLAANLNVVESPQHVARRNPAWDWQTVHHYEGSWP